MRVPSMAVMKNLFATIAASIALLSAVACGGGNGEPQQPAGPDGVPQLTNPATVPTSAPVDGTLTYIIRDNGVSAPDGSGMTVSGNATPGPSRNVYTIVSGDTCFGIALTLGTTVEELERANAALNCGALQPGTELRVPAGSTGTGGDEPADAESTPTPDTGSSGGGTTYTIQDGDLCGDIAASYGVDLDELVALNGLDCGNLLIGQTIQIP